MRQSLVAFAAALMILLSPVARAEIASTSDALAEKVMGKPDAPVTLTEFASLTCPHCANFHQNYLPDIEKELIATGKVKLVFVDFPLDGLALAGAMLARCAGPERYFGFLKVLFRSQESWARAPEPRKALLQVARLGGLSEADFEACLANKEILAGVQKAAAEARDNHDISSTPSFLIDGKKFEARQFGDIADALRKAVAAAQ